MITASWPINTEGRGQHCTSRNKAAANSTDLPGLPSPRTQPPPTGCAKNVGDDATSVYWEDVEPQVAEAVRERVEEFQEGGYQPGVDLYLASFGPALEEFSRHWPLKRRQRPEPGCRGGTRSRQRQRELFEDEWDPYTATTPEDALDTARREVKRWRLEQLDASQGAMPTWIPPTAFFVLRLGCLQGADVRLRRGLQAGARGRSRSRQPISLVIADSAEKKGSNISICGTASRRAAKGNPGPGRRVARHDRRHPPRCQPGANAFPGSGSWTLLAQRTGVDQEPLLPWHWRQYSKSSRSPRPVSPASSLEGGGTGRRQRSDFEALYKLSPAWPTATSIDEPDQLKLWRTMKTTDHAAADRTTGSSSTRPMTATWSSLFYVPALRDAKRYDRLTGYFSASALTAGGARHRGAGAQQRPYAAGRRLHPGSQPRSRLIREKAKSFAAARRTTSWQAWPLASRRIRPIDPTPSSCWPGWWRNGHLDVKVAVPSTDDLDRGRRSDSKASFTRRSGIIEDRGGDRIAWTGSLNETAERLAAQLGEHQASTRVGGRTPGTGGPMRKPTSPASGPTRAKRVIVLDIPDAAPPGADAIPAEEDKLAARPEDRTPEELEPEPCTPLESPFPVQ